MKMCLVFILLKIARSFLPPVIKSQKFTQLIVPYIGTKLPVTSMKIQQLIV